MKQSWNSDQCILGIFSPHSMLCLFPFDWVSCEKWCTRCGLRRSLVSFIKLFWMNSWRMALISQLFDPFVSSRPFAHWARHILSCDVFWLLIDRLILGNERTVNRWNLLPFEYLISCRFKCDSITSRRFVVVFCIESRV